MTRWMTFGAAALTLSLVACGPPQSATEDVADPVDVGEPDSPPVGTAGTPDLDDEIGPFLDEYYDDYELFRDDELDFEVNDGIVTATGTLDSEMERERLEAWINAVPGVREARLDQIKIAS